MKRFLKGLYIVVFTFMLMVSLTGCDDKNNSGNGANQEQDNSNVSLEIGKYKVEKSGNSVSVITNDGSNISTTTYYFENNKISSAKVIEEFSSKSLAEASYNVMKNETEIIKQYSDIKLDGKRVVLTLKSDIIGAYDSFDFNTFYNLMYETYEPYMQ